MLLRLTNGTTTLTLSGSGTYLGATYTPASDEGAERLSESFPIILEGTEAAIRSALGEIKRLLHEAADRDRTLGAVLYAEYRPGDGGDILRSPVFGGGADLSTVPAERELSGTLNTVRANVTWERAAWYEGPEAEIPLASSTQTERTGGVTAYNNDNGANPNWVAATAANVKGDRPAPVRLKITNAAGVAVAWRNFFIGLNAYSAPSAADLWLLGSEATGGASASWAAGSTHSTLRWLFPLPAALLGQAQGRTLRVLAVFTSVSASANLRVAVGPYVGSVYVPSRIGGERLAARELVDLGEFPIPPGGYNVANASAALAITVRSASAGSGTLDFVMLMPTDSYRKLSQVSYDTANGEAIVDDGIGGGAHLLSGSNRYPIIRAAGDPLHVQPGRDQRVYILFDEDGGFVAGRAMTVQTWYRPRYSSL